MRWNLDPSHTSVEFAVRHMMIATVKGTLNLKEGYVETDEAGRPLRVEARLDAQSIHTGVADRDAHLRSADFLDVERHPEILFRSERILPLGEGRYRVEGEVTLKGVTRPLAFEVETSGPAKDPWGQERMAAHFEGRLNRKDFGLTWNVALEMGGVLVGEEVRFSVDTQAVKAGEAVAR
ncbi:MAG: YceI family protein [Thermus sp.]|uniref:YceI family protein n=1 Tax=Thermus sp. TaxID=275 RepID=UPI0025DE0651|nr:YceI family protein [Thermus sp.]MCS6868886.1 YceI family protein [Thermus sp.]MCS7217911.1 YceI family protein [Thermus sp.]MDW8016468.1 YceI family protein [Thermus sp.]MDW8357216.1 YceI family protein [Thermus sp.]